MGELVRAEVRQLATGGVTGTPASRRRRGPRETEPAPRLRFLRVGIDGETWTACRLAAIDLDMTAARYLGEIVEAEARRLGWRAAAD
jgi:hypothetical protein